MTDAPALLAPEASADLSALAPADRLAAREQRVRDFHKAFFAELYLIWQEQDWRTVSSDFSIYIESTFGYGRRYADYLSEAMQQRSNMESILANGFNGFPVPSVEDPQGAADAADGTRVPTLPAVSAGTRIVLPADLPQNEGLLRALRTTLSNEDDQIAAYIRATDKATAAGKLLPTNAMAKAAALEVKAELADIADRRYVNGSRYASVAMWMRTGKLTPENARALVDALESVQPVVRGDVLKWQITNPAVIRRLNESLKSETYAEIAKTGMLQFESGEAISIADANVMQVQALFSERAKEHRIAGHAVTEALYQFAARLIEVDPKAGTITLKVSPGALDALPMGIDIGLDARWVTTAVEEMEAAA
jgi:hypothetical protein